MNIRTPKKVKFGCQRCARCCGDTPHRGRIIYLLGDEVSKITEFTGLHSPEFASPVSGAGSYSHKIKKRNGVCIFLKDGACRVYDVRPSTCLFYPFMTRKSNNTLIFEVADDCPGIGLGGPMQEKEFLKMADFIKSVFD